MATNENNSADEKNNSDEDNVDEDSQQLSPSEEPHIMLSYQWDNQKLVEDIYKYLENAQTIPVWMDKYGGMQDNVFQRYRNRISCFFCNAFRFY
jgi:hypothetical protein